MEIMTAQAASDEMLSSGRVASSLVHRRNQRRRVGEGGRVVSDMAGRSRDGCDARQQDGRRHEHASLSTTAIYADVLGPEEREIAARMW